MEYKLKRKHVVSEDLSMSQRKVVSCYHESFTETRSFIAAFKDAEIANFRNKESGAERTTFSAAFWYPETASFIVCAIFAIGPGNAGPIAKMPQLSLCPKLVLSMFLKGTLKETLSMCLSLFVKLLPSVALKGTVKLGLSISLSGYKETSTLCDTERAFETSSLNFTSCYIDTGTFRWVYNWEWYYLFHGWFPSKKKHFLFRCDSCLDKHIGPCTVLGISHACADRLGLGSAHLFIVNVQTVTDILVLSNTSTWRNQDIKSTVRSVK